MTPRASPNRDEDPKRQPPRFPNPWSDDSPELKPIRGHPASRTTPTPWEPTTGDGSPPGAASPATAPEHQKRRNAPLHEQPDAPALTEIINEATRAGAITHQQAHDLEATEELGVNQVYSVILATAAACNGWLKEDPGPGLRAGGQDFETPMTLSGP